MSLVELYIVAVTHVLAWPAVRYWMVYRRVHWQAGRTGRALMNKARSLALLVLAALLGFWWPYPGNRYVYALALTYLAGAVWFQYRTMRQMIEDPEAQHADPYSRKKTQS